MLLPVTRLNIIGKMAQSLSLYLHIPFCRHRCAYCDFNTYTSLGGLYEGHAAALSAEVRQVGAAAAALDGNKRPSHTLFFGGGTPSLLTPALLGQILAAARDCFAVTADAEITMEANPGTVDAGYLSAVRELGINRISLGVQSAVAAELALLEREHDYATAVAAVELVRDVLQVGRAQPRRTPMVSSRSSCLPPKTSSGSPSGSRSVDSTRPTTMMWSPPG